MPLRLLLLAVLAAAGRPAGAQTGAAGQIGRIDHVADGDTVDLTNGAKIRLVQIDTPEVYFAPECYGEQASAITKRLLPPGTLVRLTREPATDSVDQYGRLLRYVIRVEDGLNVNVQLVRVGAAAPYFYDGRRGRYARAARPAGPRGAGASPRPLGRVPRTPYDPDRVSSAARRSRCSCTRRGRPDSNRRRLARQASALPLSYAPVKWRGWDSNPRSRAHEAREDSAPLPRSGVARSGRQESNLRSPVPETGGVADSPTTRRGVPPAGFEPALPG